MAFLWAFSFRSLLLKSPPGYPCLRYGTFHSFDAASSGVFQRCLSRLHKRPSFNTLVQLRSVPGGSGLHVLRVKHFNIPPTVCSQFLPTPNARAPERRPEPLPPNTSLHFNLFPLTPYPILIVPEFSPARTAPAGSPPARSSVASHAT